MSPSPAFDFDPVLQRLAEESLRLVAALPFLALALFVVWLAWLLGRWLARRALVARLGRRNPFLRELGRTTVRWLVLLGGVLVALEIMDATALVGAVLGTAGVLGVALGFAFKDILENYLAGILMSLRQPFAPRDHVVIDGNEGLVVALTSRATVLITLDGNHLRLPNALVFRSVTLNYTRNPSRRFEFDVGIGVEEDLVRAQQLGVAELGTIDGVVAEPPPRAFIVSLGDSNVQVRFHGWVDQREHEFLLVRSEAIRRVKLRLEAAGMDMPEPIYRVQLHGTTVPGLPAPEPRRRPSAPEQGDAAVAAPDTRATRDLAGQIEQDLRGRQGAGLLDPAAPQE
ncbi:mechanosensitive ion channel family protein [Coralloluteibacterium stylophorae]|uniref:Small-conductance mechanosensitive channel n=1 Tax=Coralloluteibacterium stylophorae TaxID=1776034 RepID=A0A8J8AXB8_9GAMM|nr:mechanosensitive ion channel family protein [Coralloluteibacterium stylophorae]MBS7456977.1 mechanosensitive ion channel family protein [Coralloluteibacterium stylophorae]